MWNKSSTYTSSNNRNYSADDDFIVGFYQENGGEFILNELHQNQVAVFPQGAIQFEQNLNCVPATFGGLNITTVEDIRLQLVQNPLIGIVECRKQSGL